MEFQMIEKCKYRLPCGLCEMSGALCSYDSIPTITINQCNHDWHVIQEIHKPDFDNDSITIERKYQCLYCGATKIKEIEKEIITYKE